MAAKVSIENIVAKITLEAKIDLKKFVGIVSGVEYNPENFPGVIFRVRDPKVAILIFSSGKAICTGAKTMDEVDKAVGALLVKLTEGGVKVTGKPIVEVQNIVASSNVGVKVNLDQLAIESYNTEYEPEQFPGLVFRLDEPKTSILVFRSGKIVITGAKTPKQLYEAAEKTEALIREFNAIIP
jgi:transcription initiation factor TFIID TATA-box-binding protein